MQTVAQELVAIVERVTPLLENLAADHDTGVTAGLTSRGRLTHGSVCFGDAQSSSNNPSAGGSPNFGPAQMSRALDPTSILVRLGEEPKGNQASGNGKCAFSSHLV